MYYKTMSHLTYETISKLRRWILKEFWKDHLQSTKHPVSYSRFTCRLREWWTVWKAVETSRKIRKQDISWYYKEHVKYCWDNALDKEKFRHRFHYTESMTLDEIIKTPYRKVWWNYKWYLKPIYENLNLIISYSSFYYHHIVKWMSVDEIKSLHSKVK